MDRVKLRRCGPRQLVGIDSKSHALALDIQPKFGGESAGVKPSDLLPISLGGCIAVTALGILEKMRQGPFDLNIDIDFEQTSEPPKKFKLIEFTWHFRGENLDEEKLRKAIDTSEQRYCSVSASLRDDIPVSHKILVEDVAVAS